LGKDGSAPPKKIGPYAYGYGVTWTLGELVGGASLRWGELTRKDDRWQRSNNGDKDAAEAWTSTDRDHFVGTRTISGFHNWSI